MSASTVNRSKGVRLTYVDTLSEDSSSDRVPDTYTQNLNLTPLDSKYSWFVVFCSFFCNLIVDGLQYTFANFLDPIITTFNSTTMAVSLIGSLLSGFYNLSGPLAGALANKFGFRLVVIAGSLTSAFGLGVSYLATNVGILYFTYGIIGGLGFGMIYMAAVISTSLHFSKYRALATSISVCGTGIGTFIFSPFGNYLVVSFGWKLALVFEAGILLTCIFFGLAFRPIPIITYRTIPDDIESGVGITESAVTVKTLKTIRESTMLPSETGKPLPNQAYPTLKQAFKMQDEDGKSYLFRPSGISILPSDGQSLIMRPMQMDDKKSSRPLTYRQKLRKKYLRFCFNFWHCRCHDRDQLTVGDRPMYRDDIFYEGSLARLPNYSKTDPINYHLSVIRMPNEKDANEHRRLKFCGCHEAMIRTCITMTGLELLKSKTFLFLCISSFLYTMGVFIPYIFIRALADQEHIEAEKSVWLVSSIGIANTVGRIICGLVLSCVKINAAFLVFLCTIISSLVCFVVLLPVVVESVFFFTAFFGFFTAPFISLRPIVIVEFLGLDKLTNAFGLVLLTQGVASIIGPPLAGFINEMTGESAYTIVFAGGLLLISSSAILVSTLYEKKNKRKESVQGE